MFSGSCHIGLPLSPILHSSDGEYRDYQFESGIAAYEHTQKTEVGIGYLRKFDTVMEMEMIGLGTD